MKRFPAILFAPLVAAGFVAAVSGCTQGGHSPSQGGSAEKSIVVFAAASTANAIDEIKEQFARQHAVKVQTSYGSSAILAQQVLSGADADVFLSADEKWADHLADRKQVAQRQDLLGNRLVIVLPKGSPLTVKDPHGLLAKDIRHVALGDPAAVPAGIYAKQALVKLGLWEELQEKMVPAEDVRYALAYVETGAAEAGIVYATDAAASNKVQVAAQIPADLTQPVRYPAVLLNHGAGNPTADAFYSYLRSPEAAAVFRKYGFVVLADER